MTPPGRLTRTSGRVPPEVLPCPACHRKTAVPAVTSGTEVVHCEHCSQLLRQRAALSPEQRAQARALRWAAKELEATLTTQHRRKPRHDDSEIFEGGVQRAVEHLMSWSRVIHKLPELYEPGDASPSPDRRP